MVTVQESLLGYPGIASPPLYRQERKSQKEIIRHRPFLTIDLVHIKINR